MASTYNSLGYQLMATGENAGTWGDKTNTTLDEVKDTFGYISVAMTADRTLTIPNGSTGTYDGRAFIIELTGTLGGTRVLDIAATAGDPAAAIEKPFIVYDNTTHSGDTLTFKVTGQTGFALTEGQTYLCYHNGTDIINTGFAAGDVTLTGTQTLTNKTLTSPKIGTNILDTSGNELINLTATGSAVNEFTIANAATGVAGPVLSATGETNVGINIDPKGTGVLKSNSAAIKIAGLETMWIPSNAFYPTTTNPAEAASVETTATRPELKVLDFDPGTAQYAQFAVAMPKSWNLGTVTFQVFWSPSNTNTDNCIFGLQGVSVANDATADIAFGTAQEVTDAGGGAVEDVLVTSVSSAMTIAGTPADDYLTFFQLYRDAADGSDTFTGDARVLGVKLFYTTDAANDA
tara:strand:- start:295 stop:1509 length:1215 start_codon:yes stop_codon:yes gene_type:complete